MTRHVLSNIYDRVNMSGTSKFRIPALCVRVTCASSTTTPPFTSTAGAMPTAAMPTVVSMAVPMLSMAVPMPTDTVLLSTVHPSEKFSCSAIKNEDNQWFLSAQDIALIRSSTHPLALIVPGLRFQFQCARGVGGGYSHIMSCSVPLVTCFKDLLTHNVYTQQRLTCEDGMLYQIQLQADTRGLSLQAMQETAASLQQALDVLQHHESTVSSSLGLPLKTVEELVTEVAMHKDRRTLALSTVLKNFVAGEESGMLDLQYGRAFGMHVDQQQCKALREGSVMGHGFEQTLLVASIAQSRLLTKIAQDTGIATHDQLQVQRAVEHFVKTQGVEALALALNEHTQTVYCCRTAYQFDPSFAPNMTVARAEQNADGSLTLRVKPQLALQATAGEDQNLTPGINYADVLSMFSTRGLNRRDCEDGAHAVSACADIFRCVPLQQLLDAQTQLLQHLPFDVQVLGTSLLYVSTQLCLHAAQVVEAGHKALAAAVTPLARVNAQLLQSKIPATTENKAFSRSLMATSLLAAAPQLSSQLGTAANDPSAQLECSAKEYNAWWTTALASGDSSVNLSGHSVAASLALAPAVSTVVDGTRVDIHFLNSDLRVFESTAPARQMPQADTTAVKLDLSKAPVTPVRRNLQQKLDQCGPLTLCMACNLRSTLHAAETMNIVAQTSHAQTLLTGSTFSSMNPSTPSIVAVQSFSLRSEAKTQAELSRQMAYTFYKTLLSCGRGLVYTMDLRNGSTYSGMPMSRELASTQALVIGSAVEGEELRNLHALGALQSCFVLPAAEALASMPPLMPVAMQQRMKLCQLRQQIMPLTPAEMQQAKHTCGMLAQTAAVAVVDSAGVASVEAIAANMQTLHSAAQQVVGPDLHVTGGPFADSLLFTFA